MEDTACEKDSDTTAKGESQAEVTMWKITQEYGNTGGRGLGGHKGETKEMRELDCYFCFQRIGCVYCIMNTPLEMETMNCNKQDNSLRHEL